MDISRGLAALTCLAVCCGLAQSAQSARSRQDVTDDDSGRLVSMADDETSDGNEAYDGMLSSYCAYDEAAQAACSCECDPAPPWTMPQLGVLERMGWRMGGWLQQGVTLNPYNSDDGFNGPVATNDWDDEYQMNQLWMYLDRPANNGGSGWAIGGHIDMIYGSDWRFGINDGLETNINGFDYQRYGLVIPQMYLELAYNRLSVKLGHFAAILDYEAVPAVMNPFYSHSYSYGYTVPQLVTGALADYKLTDRLSFQAGAHRGWSQFEDNNDSCDFMGGVRWVGPEERTRITYAISVGPQDPLGDQSRFVHSLVLQRQLTEKLKYVFVQNVGRQENTPVDDSTAEWYGINQYLLYTINPCWSANLRVEWMRDDDGARIAGPGNIPGVYAWSGHGYAGDFFDITAGLNWRPNGNWIIRPECRWDWYEGPASDTGLPFDGGNEDNQFTFGVDAIFTF